VSPSEFRTNLGKVPGKFRDAGLTTGERAFMYAYAVVIVFLPTVAIALTIFGKDTVRSVGIGLLLLTVVLYAVPLSPIMRRRVRRREERRADTESA
jgi:hypothetical protein